MAIEYSSFAASNASFFALSFAIAAISKAYISSTLALAALKLDSAMKDLLGKTRVERLNPNYHEIFPN